MNQIFENIILQNLKNDDRSAFHKIFSNYYQSLFLFACKFVDEDIAKDFVQDCFFNLWKNRKKIEITSSLSAYLFTIIKNRCYKHLKKERKRLAGQNSLNLKLRQAELEYYINSEKSILEFGIKDRFEKVINRLPEKCSEVFKESRINGLSNQEIAIKLNITVKTVEKHISKALKSFREEFKDLLTLLFAIIIQYIF